MFFTIWRMIFFVENSESQRNDFSWVFTERESHILDHDRAGVLCGHRWHRSKDCNALIWTYDLSISLCLATHTHTYRHTNANAPAHTSLVTCEVAIKIRWQRPHTNVSKDLTHHLWSCQAEIHSVTLTGVHSGPEPCEVQIWTRLHVFKLTWHAVHKWFLLRNATYVYMKQDI